MKNVDPLIDEPLFGDCGKRYSALCGECKHVRLYRGERHGQQLLWDAPCQTANHPRYQNAHAVEEAPQVDVQVQQDLEILTDYNTQTRTQTHMHKHSQ